MIATETRTETAPQDNFNLDKLYDAALQHTGFPPEIAMFDPQLAAWFDRNVLFERAEIEAGVSREEVESLIAEGLIRVWVDHSGTEGFLPYTVQQTAVFQKLRKTGRYQPAELQYIAECWRDYLEAVVIDEPPYDNRSGSDFEHYCRRAAENLAFFEEEFARGADRPYLAPEQAARQFELTKERLSEWQAIERTLAGKTEGTLREGFRKAYPKHLFHLRLHEEFVRIMMAQQFETQLLQGYSVQVTFNGTSWHAGETTLSDINWGSTFRRVRDMRREGRIFPLRMPEFIVTEKGVELFGPLRPEQYSELYTRHRMEEMFRVMEEMGSEIWSPAAQPLGDSICQECDGHFDRQMATQIYCGERCRKRAKNRRWRERDPERARQCQARYWKGYGDVN